MGRDGGVVIVGGGLLRLLLLAAKLRLLTLGLAAKLLLILGLTAKLLLILGLSTKLLLLLLLLTAKLLLRSCGCGQRLARHVRPNLIRAVFQTGPAKSVLGAAFGVDGADSVADIGSAARAEDLRARLLLLLRRRRRRHEHSLLVELGSSLRPRAARVVWPQIPRLADAMLRGRSAESVLAAALRVVRADRVAHLPPAAGAEDAGGGSAGRGRGGTEPWVGAVFGTRAAVSVPGAAFGGEGTLAVPALAVPAGAP